MAPESLPLYFDVAVHVPHGPNALIAHGFGMSIGRLHDCAMHDGTESVGQLPAPVVRELNKRLCGNQLFGLLANFYPHHLPV